MSAAALNELAARHLGGTVGDHRTACPVCAKAGRDTAVNITTKPDGSIVVYCHRCKESGTARPDRVNGARRPAARARPARPAENFTALWESGLEPGEACEHPYLIRKQVQPHGIRIAGELLLIPLRNVAGELVGLQTISADGTKLYRKGTRKTCAYHSIGQPDERVVIAEGYATGTTIHEATGGAVAVAFDAGNMMHVAKALRAKHPTTTIIVAADDDTGTAGNPGLTAATAAARAVGGLVAVPDFGADRPEGVTDFNDLMMHRGREAVERAITHTITRDAMPQVGVVGAELLNAVLSFLQRFVAYPSGDAAVAHALWIAHTHLMAAWESTPRIAFLSPEPGSGKTRALEITETLVPRPVEAINATPAYIFRKVSDPAGLPTILYDEIDTLFGPKAKDNEEIRGILNAGHRRGAVAGRCVVRGKFIETEELPAYCAVALAGLGALPDTILTRSVVIRMRRRAPTEFIEPYRRRIHAPDGNALRDRLAVWAREAAHKVLVWPEMPTGIEDRNADVWESLLSIADAAGGDWPQRARVAAVTLVTLAMAGTPSLGVRLLADLRLVFGDRDAVTTEDVLDALKNLDESPWSDLKGRPIDSRRLANFLRPYGVASKLVRLGLSVKRGYAREDLHDPWIRYLGPPAIGGVTSVTSATNATDDGDDYRTASGGD